MVEEDPAVRRRWITAGLEVLDEGVRRARRPAELLVVQGNLQAAYVAALASELEWPGGAGRALDAAARCYERAAALGHPAAPELLAAVRRDLNARREE